MVINFSERRHTIEKKVQCLMIITKISYGKKQARIDTSNTNKKQTRALKISLCTPQQASVNSSNTQLAERLRDNKCC